MESVWAPSLLDILEIAYIDLQIESRLNIVCRIQSSLPGASMICGRRELLVPLRSKVEDRNIWREVAGLARLYKNPSGRSDLKVQDASLVVHPPPETRHMLAGVGVEVRVREMRSEHVSTC